MLYEVITDVGTPVPRRVGQMAAGKFEARIVAQQAAVGLLDVLPGIQMRRERGGIGLFDLRAQRTGQEVKHTRITSYNVCYTKLLRH